MHREESIGRDASTSFEAVVFGFALAGELPPAMVGVSAKTADASRIKRSTARVCPEPVSAADVSTRITLRLTRE